MRRLVGCSSTAVRGLKRLARPGMLVKGRFARTGDLGLLPQPREYPSFQIINHKWKLFLISIHWR